MKARAVPHAVEKFHGLARTRPTVLVIDDDQDIVDVITEALGLEGYRVVSASNGRVGLKMVERERPALVVLDMRMPEGDGWEFSSGLHARGITTPILVATAASSAARWAAEVHAAGYLEKPFDIDDLLAAVDRCLRREPARTH